MNNLSLPISKETYEKYVSYRKNNPSYMKPFMFHIKNDDENVFVINHGSPDGLLWFNGKFVELRKFYDALAKKSESINNGRHLILICCHGGKIKNEIEDKVTILNKTSFEIDVEPPALSAILNDEHEEYFISISCEKNNWWE